MILHFFDFIVGFVGDGKDMSGIVRIYTGSQVSGYHWHPLNSIDYLMNSNDL